MKERKTGLLKSLSVVFVAGMILLGLVLLYPFWRLFAWVATIIGVKGIRRTNRGIETPVVFYEHPETKRRVVFIATMHIAEPEYFAALQRLIDSLPEGYTILFEGLSKLSSQEHQSLTTKEQEVAAHFEYIFGLMRTVGEVMSLRYQKEGLAYDSSWINTDMRLYELIRLFARHNIRLSKKEKRLEDFEDESMRLFTRWFFNKLFSDFVSVAVMTRFVTFFSQDKRLVEKFILEARDEEAVRGIDKYLREGNVATVWGAAHLRGIEKRLKRAGFREVRREWFTAYRIRKYGLLKCIKTMIALSNDEKYGHCTE